MTGNTLRSIIPSLSSSRSCWVNIFCVAAGIARRNSLKRLAPSLRLKRITGFHLPPITCTAALTGHSSGFMLVSFWRLANEIAPTCQKDRTWGQRWLGCSGPAERAGGGKLFLLVEPGFNGAFDLLIKLRIGFQGVLGRVPALCKLCPLITEPRAAFLDYLFFKGEVE